MCELYVAALFKNEEVFTAFISAKSEREARELLTKKFNAEILKIDELGPVIRDNEIPTGYGIEVLLNLARGEDVG